MRELSGYYKNGNYTVCIFSDGTKIRKNNENHLTPERPEHMDIKITNRCSAGCSYCHEASTPDGEHGKILGVRFLEEMKPYTELTVGGGNVLEHPDFLPFLELCKDRKLLVNITVNQKHFMENLEFLHDIQDRGLLFGIGISLVFPTPEFVAAVKEFKNAVIHVIAGIITQTSLQHLYDQNLKMLILGYKKFRKGNTFYRSSVDTQTRIDRGINWLKDNIRDIIPRFDVVSMDNLALKQLDIRSMFSGEEWSMSFLGGDGEFSMYVDTVLQQYASNSTSNKRYNYSDETIEEMFSVIRKERGYDK